MKNIIPPYILLHSTKEIIFYVSNKSSNEINTDLWLDQLNISQYKAMLIKSKCIFNRLKKDNLQKMINNRK